MRNQEYQISPERARIRRELRRERLRLAWILLIAVLLVVNVVYALSAGLVVDALFFAVVTAAYLTIVVERK